MFWTSDVLSIKEKKKKKSEKLIKFSLVLILIYLVRCGLRMSSRMKQKCFIQKLWSVG